MAKQTVRELMTKNPVTMNASSTIEQAARAMRDKNIGDVLVEEDGKLCGIVTDRDIVVRGIAENADATKTTLGKMCSQSLITAAPDSTIDEVVETMRGRAVRRVPIVENDKPVGILSLGDLAVARDRKSVLGQISAASPNT